MHYMMTVYIYFKVWVLNVDNLDVNMYNNHCGMHVLKPYVNLHLHELYNL